MNQIAHLNLNTNDLPFDLNSSFLDPPQLGFRLRLNMHQNLRDWGVYDIVLQSDFPECGKRFRVTLDLSDWPDEDVKRITNEHHQRAYKLVKEASDFKRHIYTLQVDFTKLNLCASDFGVNIPFTLLCFRLPQLVIQRHAVAAKIVADISIGVSDFKWKQESLKLAEFEIGDVGECFKIGDDKDVCLDTKGCGFCDDTNLCMNANGMESECEFCSSCSFFTSHEFKKQCMKKESCGWCSRDESCQSGNKEGPFEPSSCVVSSMDEHEVVDWSFERKTIIQRTMDYTLTSVFALLFVATAILLVLAVGGFALYMLMSRYHFLDRIKGRHSLSYASVDE